VEIEKRGRGLWQSWLLPHGKTEEADRQRPAGWRRPPPVILGTAVAGEWGKAERAIRALNSSPHLGLWWRTERDRRW
jgi:hypothetical protein